MERYFVDVINDEIIISEKQIHQIIKVMRNNIGDQITLVNDGYFYLCEITSISPFKFKIIDKSLADTELKKDIQMPLAPNWGTNTNIYRMAPITSMVSVPNNTFLTNLESPDIVLRLNAS